MSLRKAVLATQNGAFAIVLLGVAAVWRLVLIFDQRLLQRGRITPAVFLFMWGLLPYAVAAGLSRRLSRRALLLLSGVLLSTDFVAGTGAIRPGVSTDPVALLKKGRVYLVQEKRLKKKKTVLLVKKKGGLPALDSLDKALSGSPA